MFSKAPVYKGLKIPCHSVCNLPRFAPIKKNRLDFALKVFDFLATGISPAFHSGHAWIKAEFSLWLRIFSPSPAPPLLVTTLSVNDSFFTSSIPFSFILKLLSPSSLVLSDWVFSQCTILQFLRRLASPSLLFHINNGAAQNVHITC